MLTTLSTFPLATTATEALQAVQNFDQHWIFYICCIFATVVGAIAGATASSRVRMAYTFV